MTRRALPDDRLGEPFVPAGTEICISPYLIQRHPALWDAPDVFNPDRFDAEQLRDRQAPAMLPFSAGPRKRVGQSFARIEMQIHVMTIAKQLGLPRWGDEPLELDAGVNLRSKNDFTMIQELRGASGLSLSNYKRWAGALEVCRLVPNRWS